MTEQSTESYMPTLSSSDIRGSEKEASAQNISDSAPVFSTLDGASKEVSAGNHPGDKGLDDIPDLAAYMNVQSPPTPPAMNELREVEDDFHPVGMQPNLDPTAFFRAESDAFRQNNKPISSFLTDQPYTDGSERSLIMPTGTTFQSHREGAYLPGQPSMHPISRPRKRTGVEMNSIEGAAGGKGFTQKPETKPKSKRRRRRNATNSQADNGSGTEGWINTSSPSAGNADSSHSLDGSHEGPSNDSAKGDFGADAASPLIKRRASGSIGAPSPVALAAQRNEQFVGRSPQVGCSGELNFVQNQSRVFVFSSKLANQAAESIKSGRHANIIDFHRSLPATSRLLSCLPSNQPCNSRPMNEPWGPASQASVGKDTELLTPEQLKKRQENLAKLHGIGQLLNVYPTGGGVQNVDATVRSPQAGQQFLRAPCSMAGPSRMYRFAGPPLSPGMPARRELMIGPNVDTMTHMTRCGGPYMDPYMDCSGMLTCPGTPRPMCPSSSAAQLDWQRLQAEFYERRAKEQQQIGAASMVRMPGGPGMQQPGACQQALTGRRMVLMKAGQPERFCSAVDFLRRTACPQNVFNAGCEMQMCPSPKQMNYEIDGQELIITKQLNSSRLAAARQDGSQLQGQGQATLAPSSGLSPVPNPAASNSSELAQPLSSMLQMTNSIPQPSTSPSVLSSQQSSTTTQAPGSQRSSSENRNNATEAASPPATSQKNLTYASQPTACSLPESNAKSSPLPKTSCSPCQTECRRVVAPYDMMNPRSNMVMYKCQPSAANPKHYYTADNNYFFDELGQPTMDSSMLVPGNPPGGCPTVAAIHNGHGPPSVNNTYVNATMSIQQLNIQSVQPGPQGGHHAAQQPLYAQQHALSAHAHHGQFQHQPMPAGYVSVGSAGGYDELSQPQMVSHRPGMMPSTHPQVMLMRGQQAHVAPRIIGRTVRYDPGYAMSPQHIMVPTRPEYMGGPRMVATHHDMCGYGLNHPRLASVAKKPMAMPGNVMMMPSEFCRDRALMHHQSAGHGSYNQMMMAAAMNTTGTMDNHHQQQQMISMMSVNSGLGGMEPSMLMYSSSSNPSAAGMMMDAAAMQSDEAAQRKAMETMDPVSARLAEAGMLFSGDPLEPTSSPSGKQACPGTDFLMDSQLLGSPRPGGDRGGNPASHQPGMYSNSCTTSCKDEVL